MREIHIKAIRMAKIYGKWTINSGENVGSGYPSCADSVWGGANWCNHYVNQCDSSSKPWLYHSWAYIQRTLFLTIETHVHAWSFCVIQISLAMETGMMHTGWYCILDMYVLPSNIIILLICEESWNHEVCRWMSDHTMALRSHQSTWRWKSSQANTANCRVGAEQLIVSRVQLSLTVCLPAGRL